MKKSSKKKVKELQDMVEAMGSESESTGRKAVKEVKKLHQKKVKKIEEDRLNKLDMVRKQKRDYRIQILYLLHNEILALGFDIRWNWGVWYDGKGIRLTIIDPLKNQNKRAFKLSYIPIYDLNAVERFLLWAEDVKDYFDQQNGQHPKN